MNDFGEWIGKALGVGLSTHDIDVMQMSLRAIFIYAATLAFVRLGKKRFMGKATAFDVILGIMIGSIASRAVTGNAPMLPALGATGALILLHSVLSYIACRWHRFGAMIKGSSRVIIRDGRIEKDAMRAAHLSCADLSEDLRRHGLDDATKVAEARLERNGDISIIKMRQEPTVITMAVESGVQTLRIEIKQ